MATAKRRAALALICVAVMLLGGCGTLDDMLNLDSAWTPQESDAISIASDGSVTEIVQETLDQSYYDLTELEEMINAEVDAYNAENGEDSITVKSFTNDSSTVTLKLLYSSAEDYAAFNNVEFFCDSIISAQLEGYLFDTNFYRIEDGEISGGEVSYSAVFGDMSAEVVIVQAPMEVHVEGESVTYISSNAEMISADTVNATGDQEEEEGLVLPSSKVYGGEDETYAEQKLANRVYIVY